jgi:hypothetical protein
MFIHICQPRFRVLANPKNTIEYEHYVVQCEESYFDSRTCPDGIRPAVEESIARGQLEGTSLALERPLNLAAFGSRLAAACS